MKIIKSAIATIIIFICCLLGTSCGYVPPHYYIRQEETGLGTVILPIYVDRDFSDTDKVEIDKAIEQWNYVLNGHLVLEVVNWKYDASELREKIDNHRAGFYFVKVSGEQGEKLYRSISDKLQPNMLAFALVGGNITYLLRDRVETKKICGLMMHEIGHLLGAHHSGHRLMSPYYNKKDFACVDYDTALQVAHYLKLNISQLNWCFYQSDL